MKLPKLSRRQMLAAGGATAFAAGFSQTAVRMGEKVLGHDAPKHKTAGEAPEPEFRIDPASGKLWINPAQQVSYTMCTGCTTFCGVRVRIDRASGKVLRVAGNPYSPLSTDPHLPMKASVRDSFVALSRFNEKGLAGRSTACGRGNAVLQQMDSPFRVLTPLKRVGPRNSGRWQPISFAQLVKEVTEGGDLFGEGPVAGLKALRDFSPIDPERPELGPKVNQVAVLNSTNEGRENFARRFMQKAYGTLNFVGHGSYCGGAYRSGSGAVFGDMKKMPHGKPDFQNAEFVLFIGTAPGQAGNPFKRQGTLIAKARTTGVMNYVVVDPVLTNADNRAVGDRARWVPIRPGTDGALVMGMIRWMFDNGRINADFLALPNQALAEAAGEPSFANATHLVVAQPGHPREGRMLRGSDLGLPVEEADRYKEADPFVTLSGPLDAGGKPVPIGQAKGPAPLFVDTEVDVGGKPLRVKSALQLLKEEAEAHTLADYARDCGVPEHVIAGLAEEFTAHGRKAAAIAHGGMMAGNGFYNAFGVIMLNVLIGNVNRPGGLVANGGGFKDDGEGPRYNLDSFAGMVKPTGIPLGRNVPFEKTSEFAKNKAAGKAYPAQAPWFPNAPGLVTEWFTSALSGYPYSLKALILWSSNPLYGIPGLRRQVEKDLADPKKLPLIISIDPLINESNAYADYIVPDSLLYESWGWASAWNGVPTKACTARWPVVEAKAAKTPDGQPIAMESFFIALAKAMDLPGFGDKAISDAEGNAYPLKRAEDWYLRGGANIAWLGKEPVADASDEDIILAGVERLRPLLEATLKPEEVRKVAFLLSRGGRYQPAKDVRDEDNPEWMRNRLKAMLHVWNDNVGGSRHSITGKRFVGCPSWQPARFADGTPVRQVYPESKWPMQLISFKSALQNSYSIAADRLLGVHPENPVILHPQDAEAIGVTTGDRVEIRTPGGAVRSRVLVHGGVMPGVVAVEHGFGHKELGARAHQIGDREQPHKPHLAAGINLNDLGVPDPTRKDRGLWVDPVSGTAVRQGLPAKVVRV